jgi:hypothetical protein
MSIENLIKNSREYMNATGPVKPVYDLLKNIPMPECEAPRLTFHRYGPEYFPDPEVEASLSAGKKNIEDIPTAYCWDCDDEKRIKWKPPEQRGKDADSWFVCAGCGGDKLELKMLSYYEAVRKNRIQDNDDFVPF